MTQLSDRIEEELARQAGIIAVVEEQDGALVLTGLIESEEQRQAAFDIVAAIAPDKDVVDDLDLETVLPGQIEGLELSESDSGQELGATPGTSDDEALEPGDFTDQEILRNAEGAAGPTGAGDIDDGFSEGEEVYVPPIDPPSDGADRVIGGFAVSSMDSVQPARSSDGDLGDEAIADAIRRELREDAATTGLRIRVHVERGVARLRGTVQDIDDVENAEEVAGRVEGVVEVIEELEVSSGAF